MKLVLFDLDGTLIANKGLLKHEHTGSDNKWTYAIREVFHTESTVDFDFAGRVDRQILWMTAKRAGISKNMFDEKLPSLCRSMYGFYRRTTKGINNYETITPARHLVDLLGRDSRCAVGILTGNITRIAQYKLKNAGYDAIFKFGLFGEEAEDRILLATSVFGQVKDFFHTSVKPSDITVIGDTIHDIACGKAIGAFTIGVTKKGKKEEERLKKEGADLVVSSLMDKSVLDYFHIQKVYPPLLV